MVDEDDALIEDAVANNDAFKDWLFLKFQEYQRKNKGGQKRLPSIGDFAEYVGISRSLMSQLIRGKRPATKKTADLLAPILGDKVYTVSGLPIPDSDLKLVNQQWEILPDQARRKIVEIVHEFAPSNTIQGRMG